MTSDGDVFQIAFMVDLQSYKKTEENELDCHIVANQIRLSTLKLLTHFCHDFSDDETKTSSQNMRWGYTFYNSCSLVSAKVRSDFKEFTLKNFDVFENDVEDKLENERMMEDGSVAKGGRCGSEATKYGLMDLSNDFPWGRPEIMSPVRQKTRQKKAAPKNTPQSGWKNIAFVFSHCPHSEDDLASFMDGPAEEDADGDLKKINHITAKDVLNRITTPPLLREICNSKKIRIFWIDLSPENMSPWSQSQRSAGFHLFNEVVQEFSGRVIPLHIILQLGSPKLCQILPNLDTSKDQSGGEKRSLFQHLDALVPFSSITRHMVENANVISTNAISDGESGAQLVLSSDKGNHVCHLDTHCILNSEETLKHRFFGDSTDSSSYKCMVITASGILECGAVPLDYFSNTDVYLCTASKTQEGDPIFYSMLAELSKQNLILVVDFLVNNFCWRAVMQPLTSVSATLTIIKPDFVLFVEKLLSSQLIVPESTQEEDFESFLGRSVNHLLQNVPTPLVKKSTKTSDVNVNAVQHGQHVDATVLSSVLEPWFLQGCRQATMEPVMGLLKEGSVGPCSEELKVIRKLQKLYRCDSNSDMTKSNQKVENVPVEKSDEEEATSFVKNAKVDSARASAMVRESKKKMKEKQKSDNCPSKEEKKKERKRMEIDRSAVEDFKDDSELMLHLKQNYEKVLAGDLQPAHFAEMACMIVCHYCKGGGKENSEESAVSLINSEMITSHKSLKEKFKESEVGKELQVKELQIQIVLRMECMSYVVGEGDTGNEEKIPEIAKLMNSMALISNDCCELQKFLKQVLHENYADSLPTTLAHIYVELGQQIPPDLPQLDSQSSQSDEEKEPQSVASTRSLSSVRSESLFSEDSCDPWSVRARSRKVTRYSSVGDIASSRQIMLPVANQKSRGRRSSKRSKKKKEELPRPASSSDLPVLVAETVEKKEKPVEETEVKEAEEDATDMKKVRRNLLGALSAGSDRLLQRRQSVAIMENVADTRESPQKKKVLKTRTVAETPEHKQASKSLRAMAKMEKLARRMSMQSDVMVVEESPEKPVRAVRKSPRRLSIAPVLTRKRSFYSDHPSKKSRNVEKYRTVTSEFKSPDKVVTERAKDILFAGFGSPSPGKIVYNSPKGTPRRTPRLFSPEEKGSLPDSIPQKLTPRRASGVKKRLLSFMHNSPMKTPSKSPGKLASPLKMIYGESLNTPKKTPSKLLIVPDSCSKTPRVAWCEPIEVGPHTPSKTPDKVESTLSDHKKTPKRSPALPASPGYFMRARTPKKDDAEHPGELSNSSGRRDLFGSKSAEVLPDQPTTPQRSVLSRFGTPSKATSEAGDVMSPRTPRSILKSKTKSFSSPVAESSQMHNKRFSKRLCLESVGSVEENKPQNAFEGAGVDGMLQSPTGAAVKQKNHVSPGLFGDDWGKTTPDKFRSVNLDGILPLLGNSPVIKETEVLTVGDVTPDRMLMKQMDVTPQSKPPNKTPDSFDKWKRTKRRNSIQQSPVIEPQFSDVGAGKSDLPRSETSDEKFSPQLTPMLGKRKGLPRSEENLSDAGITHEQKSCAVVKSLASPEVESSSESVVVLSPGNKSKKRALKSEDTSVDEGKIGMRKTSRRKDGKHESPVCPANDFSPEQVFTPPRFTRGLSQQTGLSPQVFSALSTKSPRKQSASGSVGAMDEGKDSGKRKRMVESVTYYLNQGANAAGQGVSVMTDTGHDIGTPTKRRRVLRGGYQTISVPSFVESPGSVIQSVSSQVSCPDYFSSENEEVFLTSTDQELFRYIDETTCGFSSDTSLSQRNSGTPSSYLRRSLSMAGIQTNLSEQVGTGSSMNCLPSNPSQDSNGERERRSPRLQHHSSGSALSGSSGLSQQDEESREALSIMSENLQSPLKSCFPHQKLLGKSGVPESPSHHRVEALRQGSAQPCSLNLSNKSPRTQKGSSPLSLVPEKQDHEQESPNSTKKYSPNITAKALSHLLQSPILKSNDFDLAELNDWSLNSQPKQVPGSSSEPEIRRSSRRSLYRTKTKTNI